MESSDCWSRPCTQRTKLRDVKPIKRCADLVGRALFGLCRLLNQTDSFTMNLLADAMLLLRTGAVLSLCWLKPDPCFYKEARTTFSEPVKHVSELGTGNKRDLVCEEYSCRIFCFLSRPHVGNSHIKKSVASMDHGLPSRLYHNLATQDWSIVGNILSVCFITWSHTEELEQWLLPRWCWLWWLLVQKLAAAKDLWRGSSIIAVAAGNAFTGFPAMQRFEEFATRCVQLLVLGSMWSCWKLGLQPGYL